jgi:hypothetical protein
MAEAVLFRANVTLKVNTCVHDLFNKDSKDSTDFEKNNPLLWNVDQQLCVSKKKGYHVSPLKDDTVLLAENARVHRTP